MVDSVARSQVQFPGFEDVRLIGYGGHARVYRAHNTRFRRDEAVKVLNLDLRDERSAESFATECGLTGRFQHPNIIQVFGAGESNFGEPFITMAYASNGTLQDTLSAGEVFEVADVLFVGIKLAAALQTAHDTGVVHRDVKPSNVLLDLYGEPKLADFGIARLVTENNADRSLAITPLFAPPELFRHTVQPGEDDQVSSTGDVFSLAATLWALLTGFSPFDGDDRSLLAIAERVEREDPGPMDRDDVSPELENLLRRALSKDPSTRPTALEFARHLRRIEAAASFPATALIYLEQRQTSAAVDAVVQDTASTSGSSEAARPGGPRSRSEGLPQSADDAPLDTLSPDQTPGRGATKPVVPYALVEPDDRWLAPPDAAEPVRDLDRHLVDEADRGGIHQDRVAEHEGPAGVDVMNPVGRSEGEPSILVDRPDPDPSGSEAEPPGDAEWERADEVVAADHLGVEDRGRVAGELGIDAASEELVLDLVDDDASIDPGPDPDPRGLETVRPEPVAGHSDPLPRRGGEVRHALPSQPSRTSTTALADPMASTTEANLEPDDALFVDDAPSAEDVSSVDNVPLVEDAPVAGRADLGDAAVVERGPLVVDEPVRSPVDRDETEDEEESDDEAAAARTRSDVDDEISAIPRPGPAPILLDPTDAGDRAWGLIAAAGTAVLAAIGAALILTGTWLGGEPPATDRGGQTRTDQLVLLGRLEESTVLDEAAAASLTSGPAPASPAGLTVDDRTADGDELVEVSWAAQDADHEFVVFLYPDNDRSSGSYLTTDPGTVVVEVEAAQAGSRPCFRVYAVSAGGASPVTESEYCSA